jgi:hypothetical protein
MKNMEIKEVLEELKKNKIHSDRIKSITISWEKVLEDRAFPKVIIKLYKHGN